MNVEKDDIETIDYKGHTIHIKHDNDAESPRDWDNIGTMVCFHKRHSLGDKHEFKTKDDFNEWVDEKVGITILPLYLYDHSGITMKTSSFNDRWDSGQVGWIYVEDSKWMEELNLDKMTDEDREMAKEALKGEVNIYDQYLTGEVYGFMVKGQNSDDSCWGFYGKNYAVSQAKESVDYGIKQAEEAIVARDAKQEQDLIEIDEMLPGYELLTEYTKGMA